MGINNQDQLIGVKEAAQQCRRNPETVRRWIWSGKLPAEKLGNRYFIEKSALESYCRETAVVAYQGGAGQSSSRSLTGKTQEKPLNQSEVKPVRQIVEQSAILREMLRTRLSKDITENEIDNLLRQMRKEEVSELNQIIQRENVRLPPGSRSRLIQKMRNLRQQIRDRIGRDFTQDEIQDMLGHEERDNEISGLR